MGPDKATGCVPALVSREMYAGSPHKMSLSKQRKWRVHTTTTTQQHTTQQHTQHNNTQHNHRVVVHTTIIDVALPA